MTTKNVNISGLEQTVVSSSAVPQVLLLSTEFVDQVTFYKYMDEKFNVSQLKPSNETESEQSEEPFIRVMTCVYSLIFLVGIVGNGLVIFSVLRFSKMRTATNMYLLNLAMADILFLFALVFFIPSYLLQRWPFNTGCCILFFGLTAINWYASVFTLTAMSIDRYFAVVKITPHHKRPLGHVRAICATIWVTAVVVMFPTLLFSKSGPDPADAADQNTNCRIKLPDFGPDISPDAVFIFYSFSIGFAVPIALSSYFYVAVLLQLRRLARRQHSSKRLRRSNRKVTVLVLLIIFVYTSCWAPYWCFQMLMVLGYELPTYLGNVLSVLIQLLTYVNSTCNPILYAFLSENFRTSFAKLFLCAKEAEINAILIPEHTQGNAGCNNCDRRQTVDSAAPSLPLNSKPVGGNSIALRRISTSSLEDEQLSVKYLAEPACTVKKCV